MGQTFQSCMKGKAAESHQEICQNLAKRTIAKVSHTQPVNATAKTPSCLYL